MCGDLRRRRKIDISVDSAIETVRPLIAKSGKLHSAYLIQGFKGYVS